MMHISTSTAQQYRERRLTPEELLDVDRHIVSCSQCRRALLGGKGHRSALRIASSSFANDPHLEYEELASYVDGSLTGTRRDDAARHVESCATCASELDALRDIERSSGGGGLLPSAVPGRWGQRPSTKQLGWSLAAAAAVAAITFGTVLRPSPSAASAPVAAVATKSVIPNPDSILARQAREGRVPVPSLDPLTAGGAALLGNSLAADLTVAAPLTTWVRDTRPTFRWSGPSGATYRVEIYDANGERVAASPKLTTTEWKSDKDLVRGAVYQWQIVARHRGEETTAPRPPAPEARFAVLTEAALAEVTAVESRNSEPLIRAAAALRAGLLDDAEAEVARSQSPDAAALARQIRQARK